MLQDLSYGLRRLRRQPGATLLIASTLALGVGANAAMLKLVDVLMFRTPAHVQHPERIVDVPGAGTYVRYRQLRERLHSVEVAAYTRQTLSFGTGADASPLRVECITPSYFQLLGATPRIGRGFTDADDGVGAPGTIVLSHRFWSRQLGGDPKVVGTPVRVSDRQYHIIGIAQPGFTGVDLGGVDAWILLAASPEACSFIGRNLLNVSGGSWLEMIGGLRDGVSPEAASAELAALQATPGSPSGRGRENAAFTRRYDARRPGLSRDSRLALWLAGGAGVLLLLACANVAGLFWSQMIARRREIAVRLQLGASRGRVFRQCFVESLLHASIGALMALLVARWLGDAILRFFPFGEDAAGFDVRMMATVAAIAFGAGIASGAVPALHAAWTRADRYLRTGHAIPGGRMRVRTLLLVAQAGLALVLVVAAGLFVGSVQNFRRDFAYDLERVVTASIDFRRSPDKSPEEVHATYGLLLERVLRLPQVESAALSATHVLDPEGAVHVFGIRRRPVDQFIMHIRVEVTPEYFATLGLRLIAGRGFSSVPRAENRPPMILDEALARALFGPENPIGQCVFSEATCHEVVGVSESVRATRRSSPNDLYAFVPLGPAGDRESTPQVILVRTRGNAGDAAAAIAQVLQGASPDLPYVNVRPLLDLADREARSWLLGATVFGLFGTLAVILAAVGIYGALAFSVRQRTAEIGLRMAIGADRADIAGMVLRHGGLVAGAGLILGVTAAFSVSRYVQSLLFQSAPADPATFVIACVVVLIAVLAGAVLPALRAARVDPAVALRYE